MLDLISQIGISIFGILAVILVAKKNKWGFVLGLVSQPFYFITTIINKQWGMFFLSIIYTFTWAFGIYEWFFKNNSRKKKR